MKLRLLAVGRAPGWIDEGFDAYASRMPGDCALELCVVAPRRNQTEEERLLTEVRAGETAVLFDPGGTPLSSEQLAERLARWRMEGDDVALLVGGADGFGDEARRRADSVVSLSPMTFPHLLTRVIVAEQCYRAYSILSGHPYHRGARGRNGRGRSR